MKAKQLKPLLLVCSGLLFIGIFNLPIGYYTLLRIVVTIGAVAFIITQYKGEITFWIIIFGIIAILFNPLIPVYLNSKSIWKIIDLITGIIFGIQAFTLKTEK